MPTASPICHGRGTRCSSTSNSGRNAEVALAPRGEADVPPDAGDLERAHGVTVEVVADHVPVAVVEAKRVGVHDALTGPRTPRAPVAETNRALLRDRRLELRQSPGELGRVVGCAHADALGRVGRGLGETRAPEGEILQREPERLGVRELSLQVVESCLERGELVVVELEPVEEVVLGAERVELLARELVALGLERNAECGQLGAIRVEASRERLVRHLAVALDVRLDVPGRQRTALGHQEGDEGELADELVSVVRHAHSELSGARPNPAADVTLASASELQAAAAAACCSRCWWEGQ